MMGLPHFIPYLLLLLSLVPSVPSESCSICGNDRKVTLPDALFSFPNKEAVSCGKLESDGKRGEIAPGTCKLLPQVLGKICGCQSINGTECSVCGVGMKVGNPDGVINFRGQSTMSCKELEQAGKSGQITDSECSVITSQIIEDCICTKSTSNVPQETSKSGMESKLVIAEDGCSVCGKGLEVGNEKGIFTTPKGDPIPCGVLQEAGAKGQLTDEECNEFPELVKEPCECRESEQTASPAIAPVSLPPYEAPSDPPKSSSPSSKERDSLSPSTFPTNYDETQAPSPQKPERQPSSDALSSPMSADTDSSPMSSGQYFFNNDTAATDDVEYTESKVRGKKSGKPSSHHDCVGNGTPKRSGKDGTHWYDDDAMFDDKNVEIEDDGCSEEEMRKNESKTFDDDLFHEHSQKTGKGHTSSDSRGKGNITHIESGKGKGSYAKDDGGKGYSSDDSDKGKGKSSIGDSGKGKEKSPRGDTGKGKGNSSSDDSGKGKGGKKDSSGAKSSKTIKKKEKKKKDSKSNKRTAKLLKGYHGTDEQTYLLRRSLL